ncbi:hypothetical protein B0H11DRAFT_168642 [Mycena galericulata]|nr:hypothetical protein B0H11DRAFT_168642 [Mycena galericulata]
MSPPYFKTQAPDSASPDPGSEPDGYAAAAEALEQAQRALKSARATPKPPTILVSVAEEQFDLLRAEIALLKEAAERDRRAAEELRKVAVDAARERDAARGDVRAIQRELSALKEDRERESQEHTEIMGAMHCVQEVAAKDRAAVEKEREGLARERKLLDMRRAALEKARVDSRERVLEERKLIVQNLHKMIEFVLPNSKPNPLPSSPPPPTLIPANGIPALAEWTPDTRPIKSSDMIPSRRRAPQETPTSEESNPRKRARTDIEDTAASTSAPVSAPGSAPPASRTTPNRNPVIERACSTSSRVPTRYTRPPPPHSPVPPRSFTPPGPPPAHASSSSSTRAHSPPIHGLSKSFTRASPQRGRGTEGRGAARTPSWS